MVANRIDALEGLLALAVPTQANDAREALLRAIFAVGLSRLGTAPTELVSSARAGLAADEPVVREIVRLYLSLTNLDEARFEAEPLERRHRIDVEAYVRSSPWLRVPAGETPAGLRPALMRHLEAAERDVASLGAALAAIEPMQGLYDYEIAEAVTRVLASARATGDSTLMREVVTAAARPIRRIRIMAHTLRALGPLVVTASLVDDTSTVEESARAVLRTLGTGKVAFKDVEPTLHAIVEALEKSGGAIAIRGFVDALSPIAGDARWPTGELLAFTSSVLVRLGDVDEADALNGIALDRAFSTNMGARDRYETAAGVLTAVRSADIERRARWCAVVLENLASFGNVTIAGALASPAYVPMLVVRAVDAIVHDVQR